MVNSIFFDDNNIFNNYQIALKKNIIINLFKQICEEILIEISLNKPWYKLI